jgi:fatty acid synthase, animal type
MVSEEPVTEKQSKLISNSSGRVLFPAAGYLYLAWSHFAKMNHSIVDNFAVEFEEVKLLQATQMTKDQEVDFQVNVHQGTGRFEIMESSTTLVTGFIRAAEGKLHDLKARKETNEVLSSRDFYKELRLRGYQYNGEFQAVAEANFDGSGGKIKWTGNWVTFIDGLLQTLIISKDTRSYELPTTIRKLIIKPKDHVDQLDRIGGDEKLVSAFHDKSFGIARCGGVEVVEMKTTPVNRQRPPGTPVLESYQFVPHFGVRNLSKVNLARFCVQLAMENSPASKFSIVEVDGGHGSQPIFTFFQLALDDLPLVTAETTYLTKRNVKLDKASVEDSSVTKFSNVNFLIGSDFNLESLVEVIADGALVVIRGSDLSSLSSGTFQTVAALPSDDEVMTVLKYSPKPVSIPARTIKVTSENYDWLEPLKQAVTLGTVLAYAERDEVSGIVGLVNCIRKEPSGQNLRCLFIDDINAPSFDISNEFYRNQLQQGLAMNVFRNGLWGSYKHFELRSEGKTEQQTSYCFASCRTPGDLSSFKWLSGLSNHQNSKMARVQYASLNFRDVMKATGKLKISYTGLDRLEGLDKPGLEFSGTDEKGQRVMGLVRAGAMATDVKHDADLLGLYLTTGRWLKLLPFRVSTRPSTTLSSWQRESKRENRF